MVNKAAEERFRIVNEFIGCGALHPLIWFIGIEEAGEWNEDPEKDRKSYDNYNRRRFPAERGGTKKMQRQRGAATLKYTTS